MLKRNSNRDSRSSKNVAIHDFLSSSSTSISDIDRDVERKPVEQNAETIKKKSSKWRVYDAISKCLLKNRFYLTALEFYTELLENGYDLPRLREFFSNPANFEGNSSLIRNFPNYASDSISLGAGDFLFRPSSNYNFDSTSIDNVTRISEDTDFNNGTSSNSAQINSEQRFNDERVAVLEFELRKARDTILELRQTLTYDSTDDLNQNTKKFNDKNGTNLGKNILS